jgi:hypothetical protein
MAMAGEPFGFAAFRSRQQTTAFETELRRHGIRCSIINTPPEIGMGCGLSVKFGLEDMKAVTGISNRMRQTALIGIYSAEYVNGRLVCKPMARSMRYGC